MVLHIREARALSAFSDISLGPFFWGLGFRGLGTGFGVLSGCWRALEGLIKRL